MNKYNEEAEIYVDGEKVDLQGRTLKQALEELPVNQEGVLLVQGPETLGNCRGVRLEGRDLINSVFHNLDLAGAFLSGCCLMESQLVSSLLQLANLAGAGMEHVTIQSCDMTCCRMAGANLKYAELTGVDLTEAELPGVNLDYALLVDVTFSKGALEAADLRRIKADLFSVLDLAANEVEFLEKTLVEGGMDGSVYDGKCCCLVGTIAHALDKSVYDLDHIHPDNDRLIERFIYGLRPGQDPTNNEVARVLLKWIREWKEAQNQCMPSS